MRRRNSSVSFRVVQAVGLATLTTFLVAVYLRQERLSALHLLSVRRHDPAPDGKPQHQPAAADKRAPSAAAADGAVAATVKVVAQAAAKPLPEPWGSHHMFASPGAYGTCPKEWIEGSWTSPRSMGSATLPLTLEAQREIYEHQHPKDCSKAKYLIYRVVPNGIGAVFHVAGVGLHLALDLGRVFIEAPGTFLTNTKECGDRKTLDSCYFMPFAGCQPTAEQLRNAVQLFGHTPLDSHADAAVLIASHDSLLKVRPHAPRRFQERLQTTALQPKKHYYWWRAQSVAYMLRLRPEVRADLEARRKKTLAGPAPAPGCISVHVRHGDKGVEAETFDNPVYDRTASKVRALDPSRFTNQLFVSTEDPDTIEYFVNHTSSKWRTGFTRGVPRKPDRSRPNLSYMAEIGYYEEMLNSLLNLDLALECSAFVGSIYSNWVRLIDELRATLRCKADAVFADVRYENPHEMDLNW
ncbi:hypothetical protein GPECTOR_373g156 [Gonium pectorale]|uniref:GT23 domain-containing protein n=1 Tax=Gonium pectorale TaxID=33097 RepID=A0A150FVH0_GONPE|nr:hypothetical protein GPECTOR_373g156 [Gonium pectorale]|eukprot:KXZ41599.1 hypothetical protein GPECTOR_373g156 [Gonium pectorale]